MRKRLAIVGHSDEGLALIPLLEANPDVELCGVLTDDVDAARRGLVRVDPKYAMRSYALLATERAGAAAHARPGRADRRRGARAPALACSPTRPSAACRSPRR